MTNNEFEIFGEELNNSRADFLIEKLNLSTMDAGRLEKLKNALNYDYSERLKKDIELLDARIKQLQQWEVNSRERTGNLENLCFAIDIAEKLNSIDDNEKEDAKRQIIEILGIDG